MKAGGKGGTRFGKKGWGQRIDTEGESLLSEVGNPMPTKY